MRCEDVQERIVSFILNELSDSESKEIANHLSSCEKCRAEEAVYRKTVLASRHWELPEHSSPPIFAPSLQAARAEEKNRAERFRFWKILDYGIRATFVTAVAAAFIFGIHIEYRNGGMTISIGNTVARYASIDSSRASALVENARRQNLQLVSQMIQASEARQAELYKSSLASLSREINTQQRDYITYLMSHIYRLQQQDQLAYYQSRAALDGMVRLANAVK